MLKLYQMEAAPAVSLYDTHASGCACEMDIYTAAQGCMINGLSEGYPSAVYKFISAYKSRHTYSIDHQASH